MSSGVDAEFSKADAGADMEAGPDLPPSITARDLQQTTFPPVKWVVQNLIPEGLTLFAGKPKLGKSWLALQMGLAVAADDDVLGRPVSPGHVLYIALEDNYRRLKQRLSKISSLNEEWPIGLELAVDWPALDQTGEEKLIQKIDANPNVRFVIIDTLARIKPAQSGKDSQYQADYAAMTGLHRIANERGIGIVVVHHVRKAEASDPFDMISGSNGLAGAADTTLVLTTSADGRILYGRGRDIAEFEAAVSFDPQTCQWSDDGLPCEVYGSATRHAIRASLKAGKQTPKEISEDADIDYVLCAKTLQRMADGGEVQKGGHGRYRLTPDPLSI